MTRTWWNGPVRRTPDFENIRKILRHQRPNRSTLFEFFLNLPLYERLSGIITSPDMDREKYLRAVFLGFRNAGYDYATIHASLFGFPRGERHHQQTISLNEGHLIHDWESFEKYPWQEPADFDYGILERLRPDMPDGMKLIVPGPGGVLENLISLIGYDNLCFLLVDDPALIRSVVDAIGSRLVKHYQIVLGYDTVGAIISNDDWGFKTQPMLSPGDMRSYIIPWHKRIVQTCHEADRPVILHSCGNLATLMDDIIDGIGYDGKHSYEDTIQPVESAYSQFGKRIAILGGIDLDFIVRSEPDAIYRRSCAILEQSSGQGGYALGTGNSVPEYVPQEHYFAMIAAALDLA